METSRKFQKRVTIHIFIFLVIGYFIPLSGCSYLTSRANLAYTRYASQDGNEIGVMTDGDTETCSLLDGSGELKIALGDERHVHTVIALFQNQIFGEAQFMAYKIISVPPHQCQGEGMVGHAWADCDGGHFISVGITFYGPITICEVIVSDESYSVVMENLNGNAASSTATMTSSTTTEEVITSRASFPVQNHNGNTAPYTATTMTSSTTTEEVITSRASSPVQNHNGNTAPYTATTLTSSTTTETITLVPSERPDTTENPLKTAHEVRFRLYQRNSVDNLDSNAPFATLHGNSVEECAAQCLDMELVKPCKAFKWMSDVLECRLYESIALVNSPGIPDFFQVLE